MPDQRPTVLHVQECFAGGTERHLIDLVRHAERVDHVIAVPSVHHGRSTAAGVAAAQAAGARIELVEMGRSRSPLSQLAALFTLARLVRTLRPDLVHAHSSIAGVLARIATIGTHVPVVYTPHGYSRSAGAVTVERLLRSRSSRVIAVSDSERDFALALGLARPEQVVVIRNGVERDPARTSGPGLRSRLALGPYVPLIGSVGRLTWQKAPEVFVAACARVASALPDAHFVLIGSGLLRGRVEEAIAEAKLEGRFHLIPALPNAAASFGELDVFVLSSRFEGGPYTPLEAMLAGTPVVVTDVAGNRDVVEHQANGLVVPPEDPEALAHAIIQVQSDAELRARLVRGGRRTLVRNDVQRMARRTASLYAEICGAKRSEAREKLSTPVAMLRSQENRSTETNPRAGASESASLASSTRTA